MKLSEAASLFDHSKKKHLKNECGGLQTLLRNYNQVIIVSILMQLVINLSIIFARKPGRWEVVTLLSTVSVL